MSKTQTNKDNKGLLIINLGMIQLQPPEGG